MNGISLTDLPRKQISRNAMCYAWVCSFPFRENAFCQCAAYRNVRPISLLIRDPWSRPRNFIDYYRLGIAAASKSGEFRLCFEKTWPVYRKRLESLGIYSFDLYVGEMIYICVQSSNKYKIRNICKRTIKYRNYLSFTDTVFLADSYYNKICQNLLYSSKIIIYYSFLSTLLRKKESSNVFEVFIILRSWIND